MRNLARVLRLALRYRFSIGASVICSLLVGVLWGANITAIYPLVEVVFRGGSFHDWAQREVEAETRTCQELGRSIEELEGRLAAAPPAARGQLRSRLDLERSRAEQAQQRLKRAQRHQAWIRQYLPADPFGDLVFVVAALIAGTMLKSVFLVAQIILVARVKQHTIFDLQNAFFAKTLEKDLATFGAQRTSGLLSRFTHDTRILEEGLDSLLGKAVREPLKMAACLVGAALISWRLLLLSLAIVPAGLLLARLVTKAMRRTSARSMDVVSELYARLSEAFGGIKIVKAFTMEEHERRRFQGTGREYLRRRMRFTTYLALLKPITEITGLAVVSVAMLAGAYLVLHQQTHLLGLQISDAPLSASLLLVFFGMLAGVADPARKMSDIYATLIAGMAASDRIYRLMDRAPTVREPARPRAVARPHGELVLDRVKFKYRRGEPVLQGISLRIGFGETVALVGPNGCGKSTLANLIPRFFDPQAGSVRLDGVDLREMGLRDLRGRIGLVSQETLLFDDTVANNIRYGSPEATEAQVVEAARRAHAHRFITEGLEAGYETVVGQAGGRLSGGQCQRIALARAILRDPEILILDEATSQIDLESEQLIRDALEGFVRGRTTVLISHRPSLVALARRIVVLEAGRVLADGSEAEVLARCALYRRLCCGAPALKAA